MVSPEDRLFCSLDSLTPTVREQQRLQALAESRLLEAEAVPVFEEATQTAAHFLDVPICILGVMDKDRQVFKSAVGLSRLGLMNHLAATRQLPRNESFCASVVESRKVLAISNTSAEPAFAKSLLVQQYGIRAYLGVPLLTATGHCLGTLAVMERVPRTFTSKEIEFLELMARWIMSEFERSRLLKGGMPDVQVHLSTPTKLGNSLTNQLSTNQIQVKLLSALTQELRTPLTSVMGMTSVLSREIYGPLTGKQKEYLEIIQNSGQYLLTLVNEILALGTLDADNSELTLTATDIEMLCQQAIGTLEETANRREQQIRLSVEPGNRIWQLDKEKVRQTLYHLVSSVLQASDADSIVRIHISRKNSWLNITVWVSHPWLGDGIPNAESYFYQSSIAVVPNRTEMDAVVEAGILGEEILERAASISKSIGNSDVESEAFAIALESEPILDTTVNQSRENLGLLLSCHLAQLHGGKISVQGSQEKGYRYVLSLPIMAEVVDNPTA